MPKADKAETKKEAMRSGARPKVLIVDHGTSFKDDLVEFYKSHPDSYEITVKKDTELKKLNDHKDGDKLGDFLKTYSGGKVHLTGSRNKQNLYDDLTKYVIENAEKYNYDVIATCYSAQVVAEHYGASVKPLKEYQRGKKPIRFKDGTTAHIHKAHQWGIPVDKAGESNLEAIATSEQKHEFRDEKKKSHIYEIFKPIKNARVTAIQGHAEAKGMRDVMYDILDGKYK